MEPKFEGDSNHYNFPSEPSLGGNQKQRDIPKIVPADLKKLPEDFKLPTASVRPANPLRRLSLLRNVRKIRRH